MDVATNKIANLIEKTLAEYNCVINPGTALYLATVWSKLNRNLDDLTNYLQVLADYDYEQTGKIDFKTAELFVIEQIKY